MAKATPPDTGKERRTVTSADGTTIAFERTGSGPPLVLVHGTTANRIGWSLVLPTLNEHLTGYAMDRRGRGASGDAPEYALEHEIEDVVAVVESIDEPVTLLGHSFGGLCALEAALRIDNLHTLILYEPAVSTGDHQFSTEAVRTEMKRLLDDGENERVVELCLQEVAKFSPAEIDALREAPTWQDRVDTAHTAYREVQVEAEYEFDGTRFANSTTPTLLLTGSESPVRYKATIETVDDALPNSRIATFDGHAHVAHFTAPDHFCDEVLTFINESD